MIDCYFDFYSDTPPGKDPDQHSPTLRKYHKLLWSKPLPNGESFLLDDSKPNAYLYHNSSLGEFFLGSDAITHSYKNTKRIAHILKEVPLKEIDELFSFGSTIGAYVVFPSKKINNKMTINGARGCNSAIMDRFDLTLECIRRFYLSEKSPLTETLIRYENFFALFQTFKGYVDFFFLNDIVAADYSSVKFHLPFDDFNGTPLPRSVDDYFLYKENTLRFIVGRRNRISCVFR